MEKETTLIHCLSTASSVPLFFFQHPWILLEPSLLHNKSTKAATSSAASRFRSRPSWIRLRFRKLQPSWPSGDFSKFGPFLGASPTSGKMKTFNLGLYYVYILTKKFFCNFYLTTSRPGMLCNAIQRKNPVPVAIPVPVPPPFLFRSRSRSRFIFLFCPSNI